MLQKKDQIPSSQPRHAIHEHHVQVQDESKERLLKFADDVHQMIMAKSRELFETINNANSDIKKVADLNELSLSKFLNVYAAIVQSNGLESKTAKLVCFTTGTKCISGEYMSMTGTSLNDW